MKINKKGAIGTNTITTYAMSFVILAVLFLLVANLLPTLVDAGNNVSATGAPLASLFAGGGLIFVIIMSGLLIFVVKSQLSSHGKK